MDLPPRFRALLDDHQTLVMATERDGRPWIASVFYAPDVAGEGVRLFCTLLASSRKLANLAQNPRVAVYVGPREPTCWLQAEGVATVLDDPAMAEDAIARLTAHAPAARVFVDRVPVVPVRVDLESIKLTDLTGGKPPIETWEAGVRD
jgi:uncharacterized protein YhbP (UPF0306 family)